MKIFAFAAAGLAILAAAPVAAQQPEARARQPITRTAVETQVRTHFAQIDANRDGYVTKDEVQARRGAGKADRMERRADRREALFARLDANKDGAISQAEFNVKRDRAAREDRKERRADRAGRHGPRHGKHFAGARLGARFFERADGDKDGRLSLAEATAAPLAMFDRADANRDGTLTREELRAARPARGQQRGQARG